MHVALVPFTGFRVREEEMLELGMTLPGLRQRAGAIAQLPELALRRDGLNGLPLSLK